MEHGVLAELAGEQDDGVDEVIGVPGLPQLAERLMEHAPCSTGGSGVRRQPGPPLELNGHGVQSALSDREPLGPPPDHGAIH
ncbi:hypothetical protein GCM10009609_21660 [Pseudonocardia aurantiaca]